MKAVQVNNMVKDYGSVQALRGVSFGVERGELFGIIGADGAGKTTLFRILTTLMLADSGTAQVEGLDVVSDYKSIRQRVGYMPGRFSLYQDLSVEENLRFFASVFGTTITENYHLIEPIFRQIEPFRKRKAGQLSGGMKQKLALCCALIHAPSVLFLDEPTTGVDPTSRKEFLQMLAQLKEQGITIIVSTPYMDEANRCDRIALISGGIFLKIDTPARIIAEFGEPLWAARSDKMYQLLLDIRSFAAVKSCYTFGVEHHLIINNATIESLREYLTVKGHANLSLHPAEATIEDCFMQLDTKRHE